MDRKEYLKPNPVERLSIVEKMGLVRNLEDQTKLLNELLDNPEYESENWYRQLVHRLKQIAAYIPEEVDIS